MKYDIHINQRAIMDAGFDIDIVEATIMNHCRSFSASNTCRFIIEDGIRYYWFAHKNICEQLPILKLKPDSAYRRMKSLCEKNFLSAHPENRRLNASWYSFGEHADALVNTIGRKSEPSDNSPKVVPPPTIGELSDQSDENPKVTPQPSDENPKTIGEISDGPSDENPMYKNITELDNNLKDKEKAADADAPVSPGLALIPTSQKKEERAPQVPRDPPRPPTLVTRIRELIERRVEGYYWQGKDGGAAKALGEKFRNAILLKSEVCSDDDILNGLTVMLDRLTNLPPFYQFTDLPKLNGQFNEILTQLRIPRTAQPNGRPLAPAQQSAGQRASKVAALFETIDKQTGRVGGG